MENSPLILPGHPLFLPTLQTALPPGWRDVSTSTPIFVVSADGSQMLKQVNEAEMNEYIHGGEYEEVEGAETIDFDY